MEIKDYLHLYLGCKVWDDYDSDIKTLYSVTCDSVVYLLKNVQHKRTLIEIKPILRPLSDMTEKDCPDWFNEWMPDGFEIMHQRANHYKYIEIDSNANDGYCLTIHQDGSMSCECKDNGEQYAYKGGELFKHLLSKHFDLFGLIEAGLAIDATTLPNKDQNAKECDATEAK